MMVLFITACFCVIAVIAVWLSDRLDRVSHVPEHDAKCSTLVLNMVSVAVISDTVFDSVAVGKWRAIAESLRSSFKDEELVALSVVHDHLRRGVPKARVGSRWVRASLQWDAVYMSIRTKLIQLGRSTNPVVHPHELATLILSLCVH